MADTQMDNLKRPGPRGSVVVTLDPIRRFYGKATRRLVRKIDIVLLPFLSLLYLLVVHPFLGYCLFIDTPHRLSFLDRSNIGNARLAGLESDLNLKGLQYNVCEPADNRDDRLLTERVDGPFYLLSSLCFRRDTVEYNDEQDTSKPLDPNNDDILGSGMLRCWGDPKLRWFDGRSCRSRVLRNGFIPWYHVLVSRSRHDVQP